MCQTRLSRPRTRISIRLNAVRSMPETDGIVSESNLAKTGGTQARAGHGTIASDADSALPKAACSSLVYRGRLQNNIKEIFGSVRRSPWLASRTGAHGLSCLAARSGGKHR